MPPFCLMRECSSGVGLSGYDVPVRSWLRSKLLNDRETAQGWLCQVPPSDFRRWETLASLPPALFIETNSPPSARKPRQISAHPAGRIDRSRECHLNRWKLRKAAFEGLAAGDLGDAGARAGEDDLARAETAARDR